jgi:RNA polymerase sigma factor (sigma-70 family)
MSPSVSARLLLTQSDARLVAFARAGHERAFEALVRRYRGPLLGYCRRLLLSEERAEDALQQALMQAWLALRAGTEVQNAKAWLYRIVHNSALNALRVSGYDYCTLSESLSGANAPQEDLDRRIAVREALAGLAALPEMQREALLRTAVEGSSHREAARELGLSEPALRGLVYRARATLRAAAGAFVPGPVVSWAVGAGSGTPMGERVAEVGVGGGGAGVAGLLMKGGAMAVTAGMLAGGIATVHVHRRAASVHRASASTHRQARVGVRSIALVRTGSASSRPMAAVRPISAAPTALTTYRSARRVRRAQAHRYDDRLSVGLVAAGAQTGPGPHDGGSDRRGAGDGGDETHDGPRKPGASEAGAGGDSEGGEGGRDGGGHHDASGDGSGEGGGGPSGDGGQGGALDGRRGDGGGGGRGELSEQGTEAGGDGRADGGGASGTSSSPAGTTADASPEGEQVPAEGAKKD